jgi:excisionase family DNA binding protein
MSTTHFKEAKVALGREDFEAIAEGDVFHGVFQSGDLLHRVYQVLSEHYARTAREIEERAGLNPKKAIFLKDALDKLVELGYIRKKQIGGADHYLRVASTTPQQWYTIDEAADYLRVSRRTIYQLVQGGQLASYRVGGAGHRRFKRQDLDLAMQKEGEEEMYAVTAAADPVLAELWDNEKDAKYDQL